MNKDVIGKYYKRDDQEKYGNYIAYHILNFNGKYYETTYYSLGLGVAIKENNLELQSDFYKAPNFKEITKEEFELIEYLYNTSGKFEYENK